MEFFFGYEVLTRIEFVRPNQIGFEKALSHAHQYFARMTPEEQKICREAFQKIQKLESEKRK